MEEVRKLNDSISKLHAELVVTKNVNNLLVTRLSTLERQYWANAQYSRRECRDIVSIPREVSGGESFKYLENLVVIFLLTVLRRVIVLVEQMIQ